MKNDVIEYYTWNILKKQLQKFKITNAILYRIIDDVKLQLNSLISNWNDIEFRDTILIIGSEEGNFYEPNNPLIANMVVVAIRNSLLEGVSSKSYKEYGSSSYLNDNSIKEITSKAIEYFSKIDLQNLSNEIKSSNDFYRETAEKYPVAMKALTELSKCTETIKEIEYKPLKSKKFELNELNYKTSEEIKSINIESGIADTFNDSLCSFLKDIKSGKSKMFVTACFKMNTRNFEKTLKILEFILTHDGLFVTVNYLISNGYVSRRKNLIKAAHTSEEFFENLKYLPDVSEKYKNIFENIK